MRWHAGGRVAAAILSVFLSDSAVIAQAQQASPDNDDLFQDMERNSYIAVLQDPAVTSDALAVSRVSTTRYRDKESLVAAVVVALQNRFPVGSPLAPLQQYLSGLEGTTCGDQDGRYRIIDNELIYVPDTYFVCDRRRPVRLISLLISDPDDNQYSYVHRRGAPVILHWRIAIRHQADIMTSATVDFRIEGDLSRAGGE